MNTRGIEGFVNDSLTLAPKPEPTLAELVVELQRLNEELKALNEQLAPPFVSDPRD